MKLDRTGLLMVGAAAFTLYLVVKKTTGAGSAATGGGQRSIGAGAASFWGNIINNLGGNPSTSMANAVALPGLGGVTLFGNGTFDAGGIYTDPGQVTYNTQTGQVQESPFSGMYGLLAPATYGF
ncbi:hypothetical protein PWR66_07725 [Paraburkholderia sp. A1RO-5]|uniref:hypothetical protein n=1 Tax=Paraburkholderia sp. A1RO-5 TaxID=3028369 RepID=UPI003B7D7E1E